MRIPKLDMVQVLLDYHRDRIKPCLKSELRDLAEFYCVPVEQVHDAVNESLDVLDEELDDKHGIIRALAPVFVAKPQAIREFRTRIMTIARRLAR